MGTSRRNGWHFAFALACALAAGAAAQTPPSGAVPPPPPMPQSPPEYSADPGLEPQVTIIRQEGETREEVRVNGQLRYVKVTPRFGLPYYLVPSGSGSGAPFLRYDSLDTGLRPPMWLLFSW